MTPAHPLRIIAADIKIAHTIFALPFAVLAAYMAALHDGPLNASLFVKQLGLIVIAMILARTVAMLANRLLDRKLDATNPRTAGRALPSGRLSPRAAITGLLVAAALFVIVAAGFGALNGNWWPVLLAVPVLLWISAYGLLKRVTALCHLYLGSSLALSPLAAALAIHPPALAEQPSLWCLSAMVLGWVAGFDVIYALQDLDVDRRDGLHSIPARFGTRGALWISRALHAGSIAALIAVVALDDRLSALFTGAVVLVIALLIIEHATVHRWGTGRIALTFFTLNGIISCLVGILGITDLLLSS